MAIVDTVTAEKIMAGIRPLLDAGIDVIEAMVDYAEKNNIEIELVGEVVRRSQVLKSKVQESAEKMNLMEKTAKLPI